MNAYSILIGIMLGSVGIMTFAREIGGMLFLGAGVLFFLVAATQSEKKKWEEAEREAQSAPVPPPGATPPAAESNGEEACADASVYVAVLHQDIETANEMEKRYKRPEFRERPVNGHDLELEIDQ